MCSDLRVSFEFELGHLQFLHCLYLMLALVFNCVFNLFKVCDEKITYFGVLQIEFKQFNQDQQRQKSI